MAAMYVRACAYKQLGDSAKLAETMSYMTAHSSAGYGPYRSALLCTGDSDGMAASLVARLDDPLTRNETLLWLQGYLNGPQSDFEKALQDVSDAAAAHPEVQAAIAKYGHVESYPIFKGIE